MVKGIDGISYLPLLTGNGEVSRSHEYIYYEFYEQGGKQSILKDGWKLVRLNMSKPEKLKEELYYLPDDIGEQHDLLKENPQKVEELLADYKEWMKENKVIPFPEQLKLPKRNQ